ncbi:hypothetical protein FKM82_028428 [Ascaphus truei]
MRPSSSNYAKFTQQILYPISILIDPDKGKQKIPVTYHPIISHKGKNKFLPDSLELANRITPWINILPMFTYLVYPCIPFLSKKMSNLFLNKSIVSAITVSMGNEYHILFALTVKNHFLCCW